MSRRSGRRHSYPGRGRASPMRGRRLHSIRREKTLGGVERPTFAPKQVARGEGKSKASVAVPLPTFLTEIEVKPEPKQQGTRPRPRTRPRPVTGRRTTLRSFVPPTVPGALMPDQGGVGKPDFPLFPDPKNKPSGAKPPLMGNSMDDIAPEDPMRPMSLPFADPLRASVAVKNGDGAGVLHKTNHKEEKDRDAVSNVIVKKEKHHNDERRQSMPIEDMFAAVAEGGPAIDGTPSSTEGPEVEEKMTDIEEPEATEKQDHKRRHQHELKYHTPPTAADVFLDNSMQDSLFFIQMPTHLPSTDSMIMSPRSGPSSSSPSTIANANRAAAVADSRSSAVMGGRRAKDEGDRWFDPNLSRVPGGHMGKLLIYKSGKVKLKLGELVYDITNGTECGFIQEVACVDVDERACTVLGEVEHRLLCTPDVDSLLSNSSSNNDYNSNNSTAIRHHNGNAAAQDTPEDTAGDHFNESNRGDGERGNGGSTKRKSSRRKGKERVE